MDLVLNNLQRLICHKTKQTKPNQLLLYFEITCFPTIISLVDEVNIDISHEVKIGLQLLNKFCYLLKNLY